MQVGAEFSSRLHGDLDRLGIVAGIHRHLGDVADGDAFQRYRRAVLESGRVDKVAAQHDLLREDAAGVRGHEKDQPDQHGRGDQDQRAHSQL